MNEIGKRDDGTLLGEQDGKLYKGTERICGYDEVDRDVEQQDGTYKVTFRVGTFVISKGVQDTEPEPYTKRKDYVQSDASPDGRREVKVRVIDWMEV